MSESAGQRPMLLRIVDTIRAQIKAGDLNPGDRLPSTRTLAAEYGVAVQTAQRAISVLKSEGVVEAIPAKGVFVKKPLERLSRTLSFEGAQDQAVAHRGKVLSTEVVLVEPDEDIAAGLGSWTADVAVSRRTVFAVDGQPVEIVRTYFPAPRNEPVAAPDAGPGDLIAELRRRGHDPQRRVERLHARMPMPEEARTLQLPPGVAVFRVLTSFYDEDGLLAVEDAVLNGDRYELLYELPIHD
jgi:GntR family transcriptional regulator